MKLSQDDILGSKILIVDDNPANVILLEFVLGEAGFTNIVSTTRSSEARHLFLEHRPDILLLDLVMPPPDGFEIIRQLKLHIDEDFIPVLVLSASTDYETKIKALQSGARDYLSKPFEREEAVNRIKNLLEVRLLYKQRKNQMQSLQRKIAAQSKDLRAAKGSAEQNHTGKSDFLLDMNHTLRTPLNAIIGFSEAMEKELHGPLGNERYKSYSQDIRATGNNLLKTVNHLMDLSAMELGMVEINENAVDLSEIIPECLQAVAEEAKAREVSVSLTAGSDLPLLRGDEILVKQLIVNLLNNAILFCRHGGEVTIRAERSGKSLCVSVADTGLGFSEDDLDKVFTRFGRFSRTISDNQAEISLGLSMIKSIANLHQAQLDVKSRIGAGSIFSASFPPDRTIPTIRPRQTSLGN